MRNRLFHSVLVDATPKRFVKSKDAGLPTPTESHSSRYASDDYVPQSSNPCAASPAVRPAGPKVVPSGETRIPGPTRQPKASFGSSVEETPSRGPAKTVSYMMDTRGSRVGGDPERRQLLHGRAPEQEGSNTPSKILRSIRQPPADSMPAPNYLQAHYKPARLQSHLSEIAPKVTPVRKGRTTLALDYQNSEGVLTDAATGTSIYKGLGWDDSHDELM